MVRVSKIAPELAMIPRKAALLTFWTAPELATKQEVLRLTFWIALELATKVVKRHPMCQTARELASRAERHLLTLLTVKVFAAVRKSSTAREFAEDLQFKIAKEFAEALLIKIVPVRV